METITVYFDYVCPYAKRGMELASLIEKPLGLTFKWKHYSLYQGNYKGADDWQIWQDDLSEDSKDGGKGLLPFLASYAAQKQNDPYTNFRLKMFQYYHDEGKTYSLNNILEIAEQTNLSVKQFEHDIKSQEAREALEQDHKGAVSKLISATPTFCFESGAAAYFRFKILPETEAKAITFFNDYRNMIENYPDLETIRRPYKR